MLQAISRADRAERRVQPGLFPIRDLPGLRCPGVMFRTMEMYFTDNNGSDWPENGQVKHLFEAVLVRALKDAAGVAANPMERCQARCWLRSGEALPWFEAAGMLRVKQSDLDAWLNSGCPQIWRKFSNRL